MNRTAIVRYYGQRVMDYLDDFGFPLRRRSLLFFERVAGIEGRIEETYSCGGTISRVTMQEFLSFDWPGNPTVTRNATDWQGSGVQWVIVATRGRTLDGFCWLESGVADIRFFDICVDLPPTALYLSRASVHPGARGHGIYKLLKRRATALTEELGYKYVISACVPHNVQIRHLNRKLGWTFYGRIDYFRAGPVLFYSIHPNSGPVVRIFSQKDARTKMLFHYMPLNPKSDKIKKNEY